VRSRRKKWCFALVCESFCGCTFLQKSESVLNGVLLATSLPFVVPRVYRRASYRSSSPWVKLTSSHQTRWNVLPRGGVGVVGEGVR